MPLLDYTTTIPAARTVTEVSGMLARHGADQVTCRYGSDGQPSGLSFRLPTPYGPCEYALPVRQAGVLAALQADPKVPAGKRTPEQAARVAWRVAKDWLASQLALADAGVAVLDEVLMPFLMDGDTTMYEAFRAARTRRLDP